MANLAQDPDDLFLLLERQIKQFSVNSKLKRVEFRTYVSVVEQPSVNSILSLLQPAVVRLAVYQKFVDIFRQKKFTGFGIRGDHLSRFQPSLCNQVFFSVVMYSNFRAQRDVAIGGNNVACWPQAISVHDACRVSAVGQYDPCWSVPRFSVQRVETVKRTQIWIHGIDVLPGRGHQNLHCSKDVHSAAYEKIQHIVETCGVRRFKIYQWQQFVNVLVQGIGEFAASRHRPVAVTLNGIDLTVMSQHSKRLCETPSRCSVGREALMKNCKGRFQSRIVKFGIKQGQIVRHEQSLVDHYFR